MNQKTNYKTMDLKSLKNELNQVRGQLLTLRFQIAIGDNNEYYKVSQFKKQIARILTAIHNLK